MQIDRREPKVIGWTWLGRRLWRCICGRQTVPKLHTATIYKRKSNKSLSNILSNAKEFHSSSCGTSSQACQSNLVTGNRSSPSPLNFSSSGVKSHISTDPVFHPEENGSRSPATTTTIASTKETFLI